MLSTNRNTVAVEDKNIRHGMRHKRRKKNCQSLSLRLFTSTNTLSLGIKNEHDAVITE